MSEYEFDRKHYWNDNAEMAAIVVADVGGMDWDHYSDSLDMLAPKHASQGDLFKIDRPQAA